MVLLLLGVFTVLVLTRPHPGTPDSRTPVSGFARRVLDACPHGFAMADWRVNDTLGVIPDGKALVTCIRGVDVEYRMVDE